MSPRLLRASIALACLTPALPATAQGIASGGLSASAMSRPTEQSARPQTTAIVPPDVFGTAAIGAGVTFYDSRFRRVANTDRAHPLVLQVAETLQGLSPEEQLTAVHRQVLQRVRWAHDLDTLRVSDLWANAGETLERGAGDSEDIAIVMMQSLKAAGWNSRDLYISIGREKGVGTHILLLARAPSGFYVLDDRANRPLTPRQHARFTPIMTLSEGKSWIHGRRVSSPGRLSAR